MQRQPIRRRGTLEAPGKLLLALIAIRIPDVPPGKYTVVAWHKAAGFFRKPIVVEAGHDASADFFMPMDVDPGEKVQ
jgi:hypothetical protein